MWKMIDIKCSCNELLKDHSQHFTIRFLHNIPTCSKYHKCVYHNMNIAMVCNNSVILENSKSHVKVLKR